MKFSKIAILGAASLAVAQPHNHARLHNKRGSPVEGRDVAHTTVIAGPVVTIYELNGERISEADVQAGIKAGKYILIGDTLQTVAPAAPAPTTAAAAPSSKAEAKPTTFAAAKAAVFAEKPSSSAVDSTSSSSAATPSKAAKSGSSYGSSTSTSGSGDTTADFPSGTIDCSTFPSAYGAIALDYLNLGGWSGIQQTPDYSLSSGSIATIHTAVSGGCTKNSFCSYACPAGYQKSQWPSVQGSTAQSIGGLYCNSNGKLELSRPSVKQICTAGAAGITVKNKLNTNVAICRTDYPGTESETIPLNTQPGKSYPLTCPVSSEYYLWEGKSTTAQYYINPSGTSQDKACTWGSENTNIGNWAPVNMGIGKSSTGATAFISLFQNAPTNPSGKLDFNIAITGDVSAKCEYKSGVYYMDGVVSSTGCTVGVSSGGSAVFEFS
ncbi:hypothetical protein BJ875DRAFT_480490 [Amylocarpus encephaloides]|uniref:Uncharacterized protein n=1 Tax=Amylocarpus encephaloides TaxID=45428 RepID=A0A9P7YS37_9HELO|nr:hypothetical protein BJ875DRAFT_480490 [Amylocarpus encephaloides]